MSNMASLNNYRHVKVSGGSGREGGGRGGPGGRPTLAKLLKLFNNIFHLIFTTLCREGDFLVFNFFSL